MKPVKCYRCGKFIRSFIVTEERPSASYAFDEKTGEYVPTDFPEDAIYDIAEHYYCGECGLELSENRVRELLKRVPLLEVRRLIPAKKFREMTTEEILGSVENAIRALEDKVESHDIPTILEWVQAMLVLAIELQELAEDVIGTAKLQELGEL